MKDAAVVITTINRPTLALKKFSKFARTIAVADKKTPMPWGESEASLLSCDDQTKRFPALSTALPWNHYCRKMLGYALAIDEGYNIIIDTDDDNIPVEEYSFPEWVSPVEVVSCNAKWLNIYNLFSDVAFLWPRGFPLSRLRSKNEIIIQKDRTVHVGVWQGLANGDTDVDAIYRLTNGSNITFKNRAPIVLDTGIICPFNSQNTVFTRKFFPLLYLPVSVTFRFTDILRSFVAQPLLWANGAHLGFCGATVFQNRNEHNLMIDFEQEIPMYLHSEKIVELIEESVNITSSIQDNMINIYTRLVEFGFCQPKELVALDAWLRIFK